nr:MAG TPA: hypothetical protein [Caudoviricetes sp.]
MLPHSFECGGFYFKLLYLVKEISYNQNNDKRHILKI